MCDCFVDQKRYIGNDPVGYRCCAPAKYKARGNYFCEDCKEILRDKPSRIMFDLAADSLPGFETAKELLEEMKEISLKKDKIDLSRNGHKK